MGEEKERTPLDTRARDVTALYAPFGIWRKLYAGVRVTLARFDLVEDRIPASGRVLDLGCGYGIAANYLALASPGRSVTGIDWDHRRIEVAQKTAGPNTRFLQGDVLHSELPGADVVLMNDFLHHLQPSDQEAVRNRLGGVLEKGALLLIHEVNTAPRWKFWCSWLSDMVLYNFQGGHFRSPEEWKALLVRAGFSSIDVIPGDEGSIFARVSYLARK
jgi:2-polyprenyl-3-methyl-5-hydroxy-6-metoxy-1,4-benzoquinol methylase